MILDTVFEILGLQKKLPQKIEIKKVLQDAELKQGQEYLQDKKTIAMDVEKHSLLMENFKPSRELWNSKTSLSGSGASSIQALANKKMKELQELENKFQSTLTKYSTLSNTIYQDEIKFLNSEMNKYIGKNIRFNKNMETYYVNKFGEARFYPNSTVWNNKGQGCPSDFIDVGNKTLPELGLKQGRDMYKGEPCGFEGNIIQIGEEQSKVVNLSLLGNAVASQSSTFGNNQFPAHNAIDGDASTFSHTHNPKAGEWWQVKLGQLSNIQKIVIINRRDCCQNRFSNVRLDIMDQNGNTTFSTTIVRTINLQPSFEVNVNKLGQTIKLTQMDDQFLSMGEVEVYGTYEIGVSKGQMGYVNKDGNLRLYPNNDITNTTGTCPNMNPISVSKAVWSSLKKGSNMDKDTLCAFGTIDINKKQELKQINQQLMDIANEIYQKIEESQQIIEKVQAQEQFESKYLDNQLTRFKGLFEKYNTINEKTPTLDAMLEDGSLTENSQYYKYILIVIGAIIVMLIANKVMRH